MLKRVVVTGMAGISPIGNDWQQVAERLKNKSTGIQFMSDWESLSIIRASRSVAWGVSP